MGRPAIPEASRRRLADTVERLRALLPDDWRVTVTHRQPDSATLSLVTGNGTDVTLTVLTFNRLEPRDVDRLPKPDGPTIVSAAWLSPRARELMRGRGLCFLDRTGNAEIVLREPAAYIRTDGAQRDPNPKPSAGPTLRGPRAWALLRTLIEVAPPYTAGHLSAALGTDDGYVSRVLGVLADQRLITRRPRGPVIAVDWEALLGQMSSTYDVFRSNMTSTWIAAAGPDRLLGDLSSLRVRQWAVTGSFAASAVAPVAAPEVVVIYAEDPERLAKHARLRPATTGANVFLAQPYNPIVFERCWSAAKFPCVSLAQAAIDSMTGNARMRGEGTALVDWMRNDEQRWQAASLRTGRAR